MSLYRLIILAGVICAAGVSAQEPENTADDDTVSVSQDAFAPEDFKPYAVLRITDRVTAENTEIVLKEEEPFLFDDTELALHKCWRAPLTRKPDSAALLSALRAEEEETKLRPEGYEPGDGASPVSEDTQKEAPASTPLFYGWLYASSPSVTYIKHPIYTFRLLTCADTPPGEEERADENAEGDNGNDAPATAEESEAPEDASEEGEVIED